MNIRRLAIAVAALLASFATQALALPANAPLTVRLSTVSSTGTLTQVKSMAVTSDANGKVDFSFTGVPTSDTATLLMVQILDASDHVLREGMVPAPDPSGTVNMGVSEVTDKQAKAMLGSLAQPGSTASVPAQAMAALVMVRSGAMSDADAVRFGPMAAAAGSAFESFLIGSGGASAAQVTAVRSAMLRHLREIAAGFQQAVRTANGTAAGDQAAANLRGDAMANFMDDMINAGGDAGLAPGVMQTAFDEAGSAAHGVSATMDNPAVFTAMGSALRSGAQLGQFMEQQRRYNDAMTALGAPSAQVQQLASTSASLSVAMTNAQEHFEEMYASPTAFPTDAQIQAAEAAMAAAMTSAFQQGFVGGTTASSTVISGMLSTMASRMMGMGGMMGGMTTQTLQNRGIGMMVYTPGAAPQDWPVMMVAGANFVTPTVSMTYTPSTATLQAQLTASFAPPAPPDFSQFAEPYKSMLELQYDLMLVKFINLQAVAGAASPMPLATLAQIQDRDRARRADLMANMTGLTAAQRTAMMVSLSQPEAWGILAN
ncbi:MAG: hypothetical protein HZB55_11960 [Deltaproteobacteria bacterium]|nr:hypothetical protein [Deltaproteobacteria bacterium]